MKCLSITIVLLLTAACLTFQPAQKETPINNYSQKDTQTQPAPYTYESTIDPREFILWELVISKPMGVNPQFGMAYDIYAKNPDKNAEYLYVNYTIVERGILTYCMVSKTMSLFAYSIDLVNNHHINYRYAPEICCDFKEDIESVFGIKVSIPNRA